jgi:hypothetical protein
MLKKYPRTQHIQGSNLQFGDEDLSSVSASGLSDRTLVVEEKIDGGNTGISFESGKMLLQSRGHYLSGGDHPQYNLLKAWTNATKLDLLDLLGNRFIMYGEWMYAKHTIFYDLLPHYFLEFDIYDKETNLFLSTEKRRQLLEGSSIVSVPVLFKGITTNFADFVKTSLFKSDQLVDNFYHAVQSAKCDLATAEQETDLSPLAEGVYIKDESHGVVEGRYKWVRSDFIQRIKDADSHWQSRPIIENRLAPGVDIFAV